jgi:hypothetical protein
MGALQCTPRKEESLAEYIVNQKPGRNFQFPQNSHYNKGDVNQHQFYPRHSQENIATVQEEENMHHHENPGDEERHNDTEDFARKNTE